MSGFIYDLKIIFFGAAPIALILGLLFRGVINLASDSERVRNGGAVLAAWVTLLLWAGLSIIGVTG